MTGPFMPGTELDDIAACDGPTVIGRTGIFGFKKEYGCGADAEALKDMALKIEQSRQA
jgi:hypothetical protein